MCMARALVPQEYLLVVQEFGLGRGQALDLAAGVVDHIFEGEDVKEVLRER
jgi:hypothetical protein